MTAVQTFDTDSINTLAERWKPIPKHAGYAIGMAALLAVVVVMPLLYFSAIAAIGWGVYWQLTENMPQAASTTRHARVGIWPVTLWLAPATAGIVLILFLLKPLFAPRADRDEPYILTQMEEPRLFAFVWAVCHLIGAPVPREIAVDSDINAAAGFRGGWLSLLKRDDMTLTIGMPLVARMSKREFAGVLAHEFGHFAQGSGMRMTYIARIMIAWFAWAAWERDAWDERLAELSVGPPFIAIPILFTRLCVFIARLILKLVVMMCIGVCAFVLRQMEYDADRYQVQLAGTDGLLSAARRLVDLQVAHPRAEDRAGQMYQRDRSVPDNFPALVADAAARVTPESRAELERRMTGGETALAALLSTHPNWESRRAHAQALAEPGLFTDDRPARELFSDFEGACRKASYGHYKSRLGNFIDEVTFVPTEPLLSAPASAASGGRAAGAALLPRYLGFEPPTWRPLLPGIKAVPAVEDGKQVLEKLKRARQVLQQLAPAAAAHAVNYRTASEELLRWENARFLLDHGLKVDFKRLGLSSTSRAGVSHKVDALREQIAAAAAGLDDALEAGQVRLRAALCLLRIKGVERAIPRAAALRARADELLAMLKAMEETLAPARELREQLGRVEGMGYAVRNKATYERAIKALRPVSDQMRDRLDDARRAAGEARYPYSSEVAEQSLGERLVGASPAWREYDEIIEACQRFVDRWPEEYQRATSELVEIAYGVERALAKASKSRA
jgi:Zn-dependent protease with chaperone function